MDMNNLNNKDVGIIAGVTLAVASLGTAVVKRKSIKSLFSKKKKSKTVDDVVDNMNDLAYEARKNADKAQEAAMKALQEATRLEKAAEKAARDQTR